MNSQMARIGYETLAETLQNILSGYCPQELSTVLTDGGGHTGSLVSILQEHATELPANLDLLCIDGEASSYWILLFLSS